MGRLWILVRGEGLGGVGVDVSWGDGPRRGWLGGRGEIEGECWRPVECPEEGREGDRDGARGWN